MRPLRKSETFATALNRAVAAIIPTPGTDIKVLQAELDLAKAASSSSIASIQVVDCFILKARVAYIVR